LRFLSQEVLLKRLTVLLAVALLVASCGDDGTEDAAATTVAPVATTAAPATTTTTAATTTTVSEEMGIVPGLDPDVDAIVLAYAIAFSSETTYEEKAPYIVDPEGLEATVEDYMSTGTAMGGVDVVVRDVVITGDVAEVSYDLMLNDAPTYPDLTGDAELTAEGWKLSREMFCGVMASARAVCPEA
jgi:hypothetical protein